MKRLLILCLATGAITLVLAAVTAADTGGFATGGFQGVLAFGHQNIAFAAHNTPRGAQGHVSETIVSPDSAAIVRGDVVCLAVSGTRAAVGFRVVASTDWLASVMPVGSLQTLIVQDADNDTFAFTGGADCTSALTIEPIYPITHGNITVH